MLRDVRFAVRTLRSWRFGAAGAVLTLAVAIGSATTLYTVLRTALVGSVPRIEDVSQVGRVYATNPSLGVERAVLMLRDFEAVLPDVHSFESVAAYTSAEMSKGPDPAAQTWSVMRVSPDFFHLLRAKPAAGRLFTTADFGEGSGVVVVSDRTWLRDFEGRSLHENVSVSLDGVNRRIVGIVPAAFNFPLIGITADAWMPLAGEGRTPDATVNVIARLPADRTWSTAQADLSRLSPPSGRDESWRWRAIPIVQDSRTRTIGATTGTLLPAFVVLLIGCLNVACMLLARGIQREDELAVRAALGATRVTIARQLMAEAALIALGGGLAGAAMAMAGVRAVGAVLVPVQPRIAAQLVDDLQLLPTALGATTVACLLCGIVPAVRNSGRDVASLLKGVRRSSRIRIVNYGARDLIVFFELGLAVVLVAVAAMWLNFFSVLQHAAVGFPAAEVVIHSVPMQEAPGAAERVRAVGAVQGTTIVSHMPLRGTPAILRSDDGRIARASVVGVGESFFDTLGLPIVRGRAFDRTETGEHARVAVVSESIAAAFWPGTDPLGRDVVAGTGASAMRLTVVGVSRNALEFRGRQLFSDGDVYHPIERSSGTVLLVVRATNAASTLRSIATALRRFPSAPMPKPSLAADALKLPRESVTMIRIFSVFALLALLLAGTGIFAVIQQSVSQRTAEFGVRIALGASASRVLRMVVGREAKLIVAAIACGAIGTVAVTRAVFSELVTVTAMNPAWPAALLTICGALAAVACLLATYRIVRLEPSVILRKS